MWAQRKAMTNQSRRIWIAMCYFKALYCGLLSLGIGKRRSAEFGNLLMSTDLSRPLNTRS